MPARLTMANIYFKSPLLFHRKNDTFDLIF